MYFLENKVTYNFTNSNDNGVYVLDIQRLQSAVVTISSDQKLNAFASDKLNSGPIFSAGTSHSNLTKFSIIDEASSLVATTGENSTVSVWDLRTAPVQAQVSQFKAADVSILSMACDLGTHTLAVGTEFQDKKNSGSIFIWDIRATPTQSRHYTDIHSDDITELKFHPTIPYLLLSGSTDGLVNIADTRITDEDEVIIQTFNHSASIHHAGFLSTTEVYALSHDEKFALYNMAEEVEKGSASVNIGDLRVPLDCLYVANVSTKTDDSGAIIGAGAQDMQTFKLIHMTKNGENWALTPESAVMLPGAHGEEIVRGFCFFDESRAIFTCGEDGAIKGWAAPQ